MTFCGLRYRIHACTGIRHSIKHGKQQDRLHNEYIRATKDQRQSLLLNARWLFEAHINNALQQLRGAVTVARSVGRSVGQLVEDNQAHVLQADRHHIQVELFECFDRVEWRVGISGFDDNVSLQDLKVDLGCCSKMGVVS
jgi:hypothetical protein